MRILSPVVDPSSTMPEREIPHWRESSLLPVARGLLAVA
jgi:hypothetical protein